VVEGKHAGISGILKEINGEGDCLVEVNGANISLPMTAISEEPPVQPVREKKEVQGEQPKEKQDCWVTSQLVVRIVSKKYRNGQFYLKKATVLDVHGDAVIAILPNGEILEDLRERHLETTIPGSGGKVLLLRGRHRNCPGKVVSKDKKSGRVLVQPIDSGDILEAELGDVCAISSS
jgi:G patch domain/KOW motif-containing protein